MARRTVTVGLGADASGFKRGTDQAERATKDLVDELLDAAKAGKSFGTAAAVASKQATAGFKLSEHAAKRLDEQIEEAARDLRKLGDEFKRTGDVKVFREFQKQFVETQKLVKARSLFEGVPEDAGRAGKAASRTLLDSFSAIPAQLKGGLIAALVAAGVASGPILTSAVAGAVTLGLSAGVVAGGLAIAAKDPKVQSAAKNLGAEVWGDLQSMAQPFSGEALRAIAIVRTEWRRARGDLQEILDLALRFVEPFTRAGTGFVSSMLPGIRDAVREAQPLMDFVEEHGPRLGESLGTTFAQMAGESRNAADALDGVLTALEMMIGGTGGIINLLNKAAPFLSGTLFFLGGLDEAKPKIDAVAEASARAAEEARQHALAQQTLGNTASRVGEQMLRYAETVREAADANQSAFDSQTRYGAALIAAKKAAKDGKDGIDEMTEAGQRNRGLLSELAAATKTHVADLIEQHASQGTVNKAMNDGYAAFLKVADGMKIPRAQAVELARELGLIPKDTKADVHTNAPKEQKKVDAFHDAIDKLPWKKTTTFDANTKPAMAELKALKNYIKNFPKYFSVTVDGNVRVHGGGQILRRWGGITEHAQTGLLREASMFTPRSPARFAFAEPGTGGEAFIPKFGNFERSMAVLSRAAQWYGMQITPASSRPQATFAPTINVYAVAGQSEHAIAMKVSQILGRQADLYARGG